MINFMKLIVSAIKSYIDKIALTKADVGHTHESADWNQNDETCPDYIKNKTHYETVENIEQIIFDDVLEFETDNVSSAGTVLYYNVANPEIQGFEYGKKYNIVIDGTTYENVECLVMYTGLGLSVRDFDIYHLEDNLLYIDTTNTESSHSIKISEIVEKTIIKPLDEKFIPDTIARVSDLDNISTNFNGSWNNLTDKPFYEEAVSQLLSIEWDGDINNCISYETLDWFGFNTYYCKVFENADVVDFEKLEIYNYYHESNDSEGDAYGGNYNLKEDATIFGNNLHIGLSLIVIKDESYTGTETNDLTLTKGIYFVTNDNKISYYSSLTSTESVDIINIKTLDDKFIPDTIARTTYVDETVDEAIELVAFLDETDNEIIPDDAIDDSVVIESVDKLAKTVAYIDKNDTSVDVEINPGVTTGEVSIASKEQLGIVQIGDGINVDENGVISVEESTIPIATQETVGTVKIGDGINVNAEGVISVGSTLILDGTDLDTLLTEGVYAGNNADSSGYSNCPVTNSNTFTLEVMSSGGVGQLMQRITTCDKTNPRIWIRQYYTSAWGNWIPIIYDTGWANAYRNYCQYRAKNGWCTVKGSASGDYALTSGNYKAISTIQEGYRPSSQIFFAGTAMGGTATVFGRIDTDGTVYLYSNEANTYWTYSVTYPI